MTTFIWMLLQGGAKGNTDLDKLKDMAGGEFVILLSGGGKECVGCFLAQCNARIIDALLHRLQLVRHILEELLCQACDSHPENGLRGGSFVKEGAMTSKSRAEHLPCS